MRNSTTSRAMRWRCGIAVLILQAMTAVAAGAAGTSVAELGWLAGCWASVDGEAGSGEQWMAPAGGTLLGVGRTVKGGKTISWEFLQIREVAGKLAYVALPSGQSAATFPLVRAAEKEVVFEKLDHDFPQRILYRLDPDGTLRARIEGMRNGQLRGIDYHMRRVSCGAEPVSPRP